MRFTFHLLGPAPLVLAAGFESFVIWCGTLSLLLTGFSVEYWFFPVGNTKTFRHRLWSLAKGRKWNEGTMFFHGLEISNDTFETCSQGLSAEKGITIQQLTRTF